MIGSSCIGASVIGGVCNNSGGSLVKRGPAYTEMALYAQLGEDGQLRLVNHLGIRLGDTPEEILTRLEKGDYRPTDVEYGELRASDNEYASRVRDVDADTPSRFNADKRRLYEGLPAAPASWRCSRCDSTPSRKKAKSRCFISAPTTPRC